MLKLKLGEYLESQKISMLWLSDQTGLRYNTVWTYARDKELQRPDLVNLNKIVEALNIKDMNDIFERV